ncbi:MAG TPA: undecaprenyl-diphosphate phosphatase [Myxococcales bacterium]|nr:undecaprenyl-diphosphate phosphatase [Myxococcales bacterium]
MPVWQALVYGVVQGLAEFLPISSSAHLALLPWFFGWEDPGLAFDVALHWGTLAAVLAVFWKDWIRLIAAGLGGRGAANDKRLFWGLVVSSIPAAIAGKLLDKWAETNLRAPLLIAATTALLGVILWYADSVGRKARALDQMTIGRAFTIGVAQAAALVPGVSRSGATISTGLMMDFTREEIARFSFLMSTPIIFGAGLLKLPKMVHDMRTGEGDLTWTAVAAGFFASAIVGAAVIRWMLDYLRRRTYAVFAWYRLALAALVVVLWLSGKR